MRPLDPQHPIAQRARLLEVDDGPPTDRGRHHYSPITEAERVALRLYLDALDADDRIESNTRATALSGAWERLREHLVEDRRMLVRRTGDEVLYCTVEWSPHPAVSGGMVICRSHLLESRPFKFDGGHLRVRAVGPRERLYPFDKPACRMCETTVAHGNVCHSDECATPLHPQWPAVYCSNECAMEDR